MSVFENDFVGKAGEAHGYRFAAPRADLAKLGKLHDGGTGTAGTKKLGDRLANVEVLFATAFEAKESEAIVVGEARLARLSDLAYFWVGDVHAPESLNRAEAHAGLIEHAGIERLEALAGAERQRSTEQKNDQAQTAQQSGAISKEGKSGHDVNDFSVRRGG